jgi:type IV secretory pathway TrbD component
LLLKGTVAAVVLFVAYAWIDGGRAPLRTIAEPVSMPEANQ